MQQQNPIISNLKNLWYGLCQSIKMPSETITKPFNEIIEHYEAKGRYYHTANHIYYMLMKYDSLKDLVQNETSVKLAIWYHDIIYHPKAKDNEEKSAELAVKRLADFGLSALQIEEINSLILATKKHLPIGDIQDSQVLLDLDLAIFGVQEIDYKKYAENIRKEYAWVPGFLYRKNRKKLLLNFLERERLYFTDYMYQHYEVQARSNIQNEIEVL